MAEFSTNNITFIIPDGSYKKVTQPHILTNWERAFRYALRMRSQCFYVYPELIKYDTWLNKWSYNT